MSASQHEYYVRQPADTEAQGPFTLAQLSSLAESGGIDAQTLYFDASTEQWVPAAGSAEMGVLLRNVPARSKTPPASAGVSAPPAIKFARVLLFAGAVVFLLITLIHTLRRGGLHTLLFHPLFWLGVIDALLGACIGLFAARFGLIIRLRAVLGLAFWGVLFWAGRHPSPIFVIPVFVLVVIGAACLWLTAVFSSRRALFIDVIAGLAARAAFAYCLLS